MGLFTTYPKFDSLHSLFLDQLQDVYDAEKRLTKALPQLIEAARNEELKASFLKHHQENKNQIQRLERVFEIIAEKPNPKTCEAMKGLIQECDQIVNATGEDEIRDAALIAAAQRIDHYEMASYGVLRSLAQQIGFSEAAKLLQECLDEEKAADKRLTQLAENQVNLEAQTADIAS